jgi:hypothetical protein
MDGLSAASQNISVSMAELSPDLIPLEAGLQSEISAFLKPGYVRVSANQPWRSIRKLQMTSKTSTALITGGNSGIGRATATKIMMARIIGGIMSVSIGIHSSGGTDSPVPAAIAAGWVCTGQGLVTGANGGKDKLGSIE